MYGVEIDFLIGVIIFNVRKITIVLHNPNKTLMKPHTNDSPNDWTDDWHPEEIVMYTEYVVPTINESSKKTWTQITSLGVQIQEEYLAS